MPGFCTRRLMALLVCLSACGLLADTARALLTSYDSRSAFIAAVPDATVQTYDGVFSDTLIPNGTAYEGVTYTLAAGVDGVLTDLNYTSTGQFSLAANLPGNNYGFLVGSITLTFDRPMNAFAIDPFATSQLDAKFSATTDSGETAYSVYDPFVSHYYPPPIDRTYDFGHFIGFTSDLAFSTVTVRFTADIDDQNLAYSLDTLRYREAPAAQPVPEPATAMGVALAVGALAAGIARRQRRHRA